MAKTYDISLSIKDVATGQEVFGAPLTARQTVEESTGGMSYKVATGAAFTAMPTDRILDTIQLLVVRADQTVTIRLDGQVDKGIRLKATTGLLLIVDATIDVGAATNALITNTGTTTALVTAFAAGT